MEQVKKLRAITGAGILDCQKALKETGSIEEAIDFLRKKGLAAAVKKSERTASEGLISVFINKNSYGLVELNCETDFVARNKDFKEAASKLAEHASTIDFKDVNEFLASNIDGMHVSDYLKGLIAKFGENTVIGKAINGKTSGFFQNYVHANGKIAVVVEAEGENQDVTKDVAMHIAALAPMFLDEKSVDSKTLEKEKEIYRTELSDSGKPAAVIEKIVEGKVAKFYEGQCLLKQKFVKDGNQTVEEYIKGKIKILSFKRFTLGEN